MGTNSGDSDEKPVHSVTLSDYYIGETEVTQALWTAVMGTTFRQHAEKISSLLPLSILAYEGIYKEGNDYPVYWVSWNECMEFVNRLNQMTGKKFALPTEAQWEFAARGGNKSHGYSYSGSNNIGDVAWYSDNSSNQIHQVAMKRANELGIYDMSGNVWEWCSDWGGSYSSYSQTDPAGAQTGSLRVNRGGDFKNNARYSRSVSRNGSAPDTKDLKVGLRLVLLIKKSKDVETNNVKGVVKGGKDIETFNVKGVTFRMRRVEGGTFQMGSNNGYSDEKPVHSVTLSDYYIGETEVTQALWTAVMGTTVRQQRDKADTSRPIKGEGDNYPIYYVSWSECMEFVSRLSQITGRRFALPTEAQWEYAARGGNKSRAYTYSGSNNIYDVAWHKDNSSKLTHPVGTKMANELGIYDMSGNVFEWCQDWYGTYSSSSQTDPAGASSGSNRVNRGGSWINDTSYCRSANRRYSSPGNRTGNLGLRLVLLF